MVNNSPYNFDWSNITFRHFHGFCNDLLNEFLIPRPSNIDDIVTVLENALENKNLINSNSMPYSLMKDKITAGNGTISYQSS